MTDPAIHEDRGTSTDAGLRATPRLAVPHRNGGLPWLVLIVVLAAWTAWHLGATELTRAVPGPGGTSTVVPDTFASVDHPFHAARAATLLDTLRDGDLLRWVGSHEGGYPVEFYPLGVPWLTVTVWVLAFGAIPILSAYKLTVIALLLAPVLAFAALGRVGRMALPVAGVGLVAHLAVPAGSWDGGYTELVVWGLVTNVAGYVAALGFLAALVMLVSRPSRWSMLATVLLAVFAVGCNTRSTIALLAATAGVLLAVAVGREDGLRPLLPAVRRVAVAGTTAGLLAAPILFNSLRFSDQYEFIRYSWYDGVGDYLAASVDAVSVPVALLGAAGLMLGLLGVGSFADRAVSWSLVAYVVCTAVFGGLSPDGGLVGQLEATRLMPFQRLLLIYLAAVAVIAAVRLVGRALRSEGLAVAGASVGAAVAAVLIVVAPVGAIPEDQRPLQRPQTTGVAEFADLDAAVGVADATAPAGSAILLAGSGLSWHEPMWAPAMTDRSLHYDNWLWLWQTWHRADGIRYDGQAILLTSWDDMLSADYLARNGIGAVVAVTPQVEERASQSDVLERVEGPGYPVYRVVPDAGIVAGAGMAASATWHGGQRITATVDGNGGELTIHQTWFPRWEATVNGESVDVRRGYDGQLRIDVPAGLVTIDVRYGTDAWDWLFRGLAVLGVLLVVLVVARPAAMTGSIDRSKSE